MASRAPLPDHYPGVLYGRPWPHLIDHFIRLARERSPDLAYASACDYPGVLDAAAVEAELAAYLAALSVHRRIVRLGPDWSLAREPELAEEMQLILERAAQKPEAVFGARVARDVIHARAAMDARDSRDAFAARNTRAVGDAAALRDIRAAGAFRAARMSVPLAPLHRFAALCILRDESSSSWDLSLLALTAIGARELGYSHVSAWAEPVYRAFLAGCWKLYWTKTTLYWIAKPKAHLDRFVWTEPYWDEEGPNGPVVRRARDLSWPELHREDGPALETDIGRFHFLNGNLVPDPVTTAPQTLTVAEILAEPNAEVRRIMIERKGWARWIEEGGATLVDEATDQCGRPLRLWSIDEDILFVEVTNATPEADGSFKTFVLRINPLKYDGEAGLYAKAAVASTWRWSHDPTQLLFPNWRDYLPEIET